MVNTQSKIESLEEQISKLVAENDKLSRENAEISELRKKFADVEIEDTRIKAENMKFWENMKPDSQNWNMTFH